MYKINHKIRRKLNSTDTIVEDDNVKIVKLFGITIYENKLDLVSRQESDKQAGFRK